MMSDESIEIIGKVEFAEYNAESNETVGILTDAKLNYSAVSFDSVITDDNFNELGRRTGDGKLEVYLQPIETAPKDGSEINLYVDGQMYVGLFYGGRWRESLDRMILEPTHWAPIPILKKKP